MLYSYNIMEVPESIRYIDFGDGVGNHPIDAVSVGGKLGENIQVINNLVTSIDENSTDTQYPSAKCVYEMIYGHIDTPTSNLWNGSNIWDRTSIWQQN